MSRGCVLLPAVSNVALKEWAVAISALERGDQIVLLRKGGIREEGKHFRLKHPAFFLYPTYEHQQRSLVRPDARPLFDEAEEQADPDLVTLASWAEVTDVVEVTSESELAALERFHIWTPEYAEKRFRWKPRHPLAVMLLRVYVLQQPQAAPVMAEYGGCASWLTLVEDYPVGAAIAVLTDREYRRRARMLKEALANAATAD